LARSKPRRDEWPERERLIERRLLRVNPARTSSSSQRELAVRRSANDQLVSPLSGGWTRFLCRCRRATKDEIGKKAVIA